MSDRSAPDRPVISVTICMGSSCFSRGNNRNIEIIQEYASNAELPVRIEPRGHLCEGLCKHGPNLIIDGQLYQAADPVAVVGALNLAIHKAKS
ncbi:MAG: (2Fe-2S) ferredoxin domain-containing protein [Phycisphaerales bacterium]|nr:(2Fe-2S) ferredoxin domain-containing protein [Phycisphaerales bacterium]